MSLTLRSIILTGLLAPTLSASTVIYFNQSQWQAAMSAQDSLPLSNVSFGNSDWTTSFQSTPSFNSLTSQSATAAGAGMGISVVSGYDPLGAASNSLLGQVSNGVWSDTLSKYGSTTFSFSESLYGFGGDFDVTGSNGLLIYPGTNSPYAISAGYDGFIGVISSQPLSDISILWEPDGNGNECFGTSYTLSDFQLAATNPLSTPEPDFRYALAGLLIFVLTIAKAKRF